MASDAVLELTNDNFESEVLQSDKPVVVDFWAEWCMPCRMLAPTIDQLADDYQGRVKVGKMDVDNEGNRAIAAQYGISNIPTVIVFNGGQVAQQMVGPNKNALVEAVEKVTAG